jgi:hypothetical protein
MTLPSLSNCLTSPDALPHEAILSLFAGGGKFEDEAEAPPTLTGALRAGSPGVVELAPAKAEEEPGAGKNRFGGAQAGR